MVASCLFWALLLLTLPLPWLVAAAAAAAWHEGCHCVCARVLGGRVAGFRLDASGATLDVTDLTPWAEFATALAGPLGGLLLTALWRHFPRLALCAGVQSAFNLLPFYPLDGGRALRCSLETLLPGHAHAVCLAAEGCCLVTMTLFALAKGLYFPLFWGLLLLLPRKRPCKAPFLKVQ